MRQNEASGTRLEEGLPRTIGTLGGVSGCVVAGCFLMTVITVLRESEQFNRNDMQRMCDAFIASLILEAGVGAVAAVSANCSARFFLRLFPGVRDVRTQLLLPSVKSSLEITAAVGLATASYVGFTAARL